MNNPFEQIEARLSNIENLLLDIKHQPVKEKTSEPSDELLTVEQAAEFLSLATPTVYGLVQRGELPVMKRTKRLYFSKKELIEYMKAGRKKSHHEIEAVAQNYLSK